MEQELIKMRRTVNSSDYRLYVLEWQMALWRRNHLKQPFIVDLGGSKDSEELEEGEIEEVDDGTQLNFTTNENGTVDTLADVAELPDLNVDSDYFLD
jgi:hypothetical protein